MPDLENQSSFPNSIEFFNSLDYEEKLGLRLVNDYFRAGSRHIELELNCQCGQALGEVLGFKQSVSREDVTRPLVQKINHKAPA